MQGPVKKECYNFWYTFEFYEVDDILGVAKLFSFYENFFMRYCKLCLLNPSCFAAWVTL
jgi:hypothetical protein